MNNLKHKLLTLLFINIIIFSTCEFTTIPINFINLFSTDYNISPKENKNILIQPHKISLNTDCNKIQSDLLNIINNDPDSIIEIIIYLKGINIDDELDTINQENISLKEIRSSIYNVQLKNNEPLLDKVSQIIQDLDGIVLSKSIILNALFVRIKAQNILLLNKVKEIIRIEKDVKLNTRLNYSVPSVVNYLGSDPRFQWNYTAYNGSGINVAVVDTGIYKSHPALTGKVIHEKDFTGSSNPNDLDGHGTHVAGIIVSNSSTYTGIAPGVNLINVKSLTSGGVGNSFWVIDGIEWALVNNDFNISIVSMSAGATVEANGTNGFACFVDYIVKYYKVLWVNAAGNSGPSSKSIEVPADAYNCIAVGNIDDHNTIDRSDDSLASSSSRGPTWDIPRIKPDISAPGTNIMSCNNGLVPLYVSKSGTSMATPLVSGASALLWQYYKENPISGISENYYPMLIKAILLHTAEDQGTPGPDYEYGHGYIDLVSANRFSSYGTALIDSFSIFTSSVYKYKFVITNNCEFNVSLLWYKDANYDINNHMYTGWQDNAISNLNLYVENGNFQTFASSTSLYDNFESIKINCTPGTYYVKIEVANRILHTSPEEFILISSAPLEKIPWIDIYMIFFIVLIVGSVIALVLLVIYYVKSGKKKPEESVEFGYLPEEDQNYY